MKIVSILAAAGLSAVTSFAHAHVTVSPKEVRRASQDTYSFNVPAEGASATTAVELELPAGVDVLSIEAPAAEHAVARSQGRIVSVRLSLNIAPGLARQLALVARSPLSGERVQWKVRQMFADGTHADWMEEPGSRRPAPVTKLVE